MVLDWRYVALAIGCAAAITFALRALPFAIRETLKDSPLLAHLNAWMPLGVTVILVVYCLRMIDLHDTSLATARLAGVAATVAVHLWRGNLFLSLFAGTGVCVVLANGWLAGLLRFS
ncbi:Uncharacterised protein [uncultured Comamonas sp.]|nr:Uncharacterised protein [uncultured Comamonas sp.]